MRVPLRAFLLVTGALASTGAAGAIPSRPPGPRIELPPVFRAEPLQVRFYDPYRLLSGDAEEWLQKEVTLAFEQSGIGIRFVGAGGPRVIPATLYPELPDRWGVSPETIGVAIGAEGERRSVFLSLGAAERALGFPRSQRTVLHRKGKRPKRRGAARQPRRLGIALGRVLAHELTHSIAPECPHTRSGLMAAQLSRRMLTAPGVRFDALATRHLQQGAAELESSAPQSG